MLSFKYYKSYGIEYSSMSGTATVQGFMGLPLKTFRGVGVKGLKMAEKYIDALYCG